MGTGTDYLQRRGAAYQWRRRVPRPLSLRPDHVVSRSLRTSDPDLARRRARACSARFDAAMLRFMENGTPPTREQLARVLDDIFRRVLDDGERTRAEYENGPDWIPHPQTDPLYEGLEPEEWDSVPSPPEIWAEEWRDAVLLNRVADVRPLVDDALDARGLAPPRARLAWRRFMRLALLAAADAHAIDAKRETGDYSAGWPLRCGIPPEQLPAFGPEPVGAAQQQPAAAIKPAPEPEAIVAPSTAPSVLLSVSYAEFMAAKPVWTRKTRAQAEAVLSRFISLMEDRPVGEITQAVAEKFKQRLREVPVLNGKSVYTGVTVRESVLAADRIALALAGNTFPIRIGPLKLDEARARRLVQRLSLKTVNRVNAVSASAPGGIVTVTQTAVGGSGGAGDGPFGAPGSAGIAASILTVVDTTATFVATDVTSKAGRGGAASNQAGAAGGAAVAASVVAALRNLEITTVAAGGSAGASPANMAGNQGGPATSIGVGVSLLGNVDIVSNATGGDGAAGLVGGVGGAAFAQVFGRSLLGAAKTVASETNGRAGGAPPLPAAPGAAIARSEADGGAPGSTALAGASATDPSGGTVAASAQPHTAAGQLAESDADARGGDGSGATASSQTLAGGYLTVEDAAQAQGGDSRDAATRTLANGGADATPTTSAAGADDASFAFATGASDAYMALVNPHPNVRTALTGGLVFGIGALGGGSYPGALSGPRADSGDISFTLPQSVLAPHQPFHFVVGLLDGSGEGLAGDLTFSVSQGQTTVLTKAGPLTGYFDDNPLLFDPIAGPDGTYNVTVAYSLTGAVRPLGFDFVAGIAPVCFAAGTRLRTASGEVQIERLRVGDMIATVEGGAVRLRPIRWIGHRRVEPAEHSRPEMVLPIRIARGAFAEGVPVRDLRVSPDHCIHVDGHLIAARRLINHATIRQETSLHPVVYFHVELDRRGVILAEGLTAESYLDMGNRAFFANADVASTSRPDVPVAETSAQSALADDVVEPIWRRLAARAAARGRKFPAPDVRPARPPPSTSSFVAARCRDAARLAAGMPSRCRRGHARPGWSRTPRRPLQRGPGSKTAAVWEYASPASVCAARTCSICQLTAPGSSEAGTRQSAGPPKSGAGRTEMRCCLCGMKLLLSRSNFAEAAIPRRARLAEAFSRPGRRWQLGDALGIGIGRRSRAGSPDRAGQGRPWPRIPAAYRKQRCELHGC